MNNNETNLLRELQEENAALKKLLEENKKSFLEKLRRMRKANEVLQSQSLPAEQPEKSPHRKNERLEKRRSEISQEFKDKFDKNWDEGKVDIKQFVADWMDSHEPGTFVTNEHGQYIYSCGAVSLNLKVFFEELLEEYANQPRKEWISLDDRLPEKRADVIVWFEPRESAIMCLWNNVFLEEGATYWMPVPTPPQKQQIRR